MKLKHVLLVALSVLFVGGAVLFNDVFPKAAPMKCPAADSVVLSEIGSSDGEAVVLADRQNLEKLLEMLQTVRPTRKQALNDYPTVRPWYKIKLQTSEGSRQIFVYKVGKQVYAESPYEGIYKAKEELFDTVFNLFEEGSQ